MMSLVRVHKRVVLSMGGVLGVLRTKSIILILLHNDNALI